MQNNRINPILTAFIQGPWAMEKLPLDFCKEHDLLEITMGENNKKAWTIKARPHIDC